MQGDAASGECSRSKPDRIRQAEPGTAKPKAPHAKAPSRKGGQDNRREGSNLDHAADFIGGKTSDGNRWKDCHYTNKIKQAAREAVGKGRP